MDREVLLIDFDGTLAENVWDKDPVGIGAPIWPVIKALQNASLKHRIIIKTARHSAQEPELVEWLRKHQVPFEHIEFDKRIAKFYVDDRNLSLDEFIKRFGDE